MTSGPETGTDCSRSRYRADSTPGPVLPPGESSAGRDRWKTVGRRVDRDQERPANSRIAVQLRHTDRQPAWRRYTDLYSGWLGSRVVSVLDSGAEGPGFKSQSRRCRVTVLGKLFTPIVPLFTKQRNW